MIDSTVILVIAVLVVVSGAMLAVAHKCFLSADTQLDELADEQLRIPHWEAVEDEDGLMWRVRWSEPDTSGRYLWVGHYATESCPAEVFAKSHAERFNRECRCPWEWPIFFPRALP